MIELSEGVTKIGPYASSGSVISKRIAVAPHGIEVPVPGRKHHAARVTQAHVARIDSDRFAQ